MDELEIELQQIYRKAKETDTKHLPDFQALIHPEAESPIRPKAKRIRRISPWTTRVASLLFLMSLTWFLWPKPEPDVLENGWVTQGLLPTNSAIWDWESPTQSLLNTQSIQQLKLEE
ncbi:MAG: hypothetical protein AAFV80_15520 [Bacteroidota bacterium]